MERNLDFNEISDGHKYESGDLVKVACDSCKGASLCCHFAEDTILLDPFDTFNISLALNKSFPEMLDKELGLNLIDGVITPYLKQKEGHCSFLNSQGLCDIHSYRPGFCRLFPLGRIWDSDGSFKYFNQIHECPNKTPSKVKIKNWIGLEGLKDYEAFTRSWHQITVEIRKISLQGDANLLKLYNMKMLNEFFMKPWNLSEDFYEEYFKRVETYKNPSSD